MTEYKSGVDAANKVHEAILKECRFRCLQMMEEHAATSNRLDRARKLVEQRQKAYEESDACLCRMMTFLIDNAAKPEEEQKFLAEALSLKMEAHSRDEDP